MRVARFSVAAATILLFLHGVSAKLQFLNLDFSLDRQTYTWADSLAITKALSQSLELQFQNRSAATLIKKSVFGEGGDRWQKSARTGATLVYQLKPRMKVGLDLSQDFDRLEKKRYFANRAKILTKYDSGNLELSQRTGVVWEERQIDPLRNRDAGLGFNVQAKFAPLQNRAVGQVSVDGELTTVHKTPLKSLTVGYNIERQTHRGDTLSLHGTQSFAEKKYFPSTTDFELTAQQRTEQRRWDFHVGSYFPARIHFSADAAYRFDSYNYEYNQLASDYLRQNDNLNSLFEYQFGFTRRFGARLNVQGSYLYNRSKDDFGTQQTNQRSETGQLGMTAELYLMSADTVQISGQIGVTSYFASSTSTFFSDRDRAIKVASLRGVHRFNRFLVGWLEGSFRGFHTVYISGNLSANNNFNNVYILSPSLVWTPVSGIAITQNYQMHANYINYEYEKSDLSGRSTLYRRANFANKVTLTSSPKSDFILEYSYRYEDFGRLVYSDQWQQQVSWDRRTHRPRFAVDYHPSKHFRFQPYAAYEIQTSYDHLFDTLSTLGRRQKSEEFTRTLVGFDLEWTLSANSYINCKLQRRVQDYQNQRNQEYDLFTLSIKRFL